MMTAPSRSRRLLASLAALSVLFAPLTQLAHAQAMVHEAAVACHDTAGTHHAMEHAAVPRRSGHSHGATCCDSCPAGCQTAAFAATSVALPPIVTARRSDGAVLIAAAESRSTQHRLPFSLAPPTASA